MDPLMGMGRRSRATVAVWLLSLVTVHAAAQEPPRFSASVEVLPVDVTVVDANGRPVTGLGVEDFSASVDGVRRRVISAEWVPLLVDVAVPPPAPPPGYSSNEGATNGRLILLVVDQPNIRFGGMASIQRAVDAFVDGLQPTDRIAAVGIGPTGASTPFTADRELVKRAIRRMSGSAEIINNWQFNVTMAEAVEISVTNPLLLEEVARRECAGMGPQDFTICQSNLQNIAHSIAGQVFGAGRETFYGMQRLLEALSDIDAPKTLVLITEGFVFEENAAALGELGRLAEASRTAIYALKMDSTAIEAAVRNRSTTLMADRRLRSTPIEILTAAARGTVVNGIGSAAGSLARIASEISGYYLLGLEGAPADSLGGRHRIAIEVARRGVEVRWRREVTGNLRPGAPRDPQRAAIQALNSPLMISALPVRVGTFALPDPNPDRVQVLLHASIGADYTAPAPMALAYTITDAQGQIVESQGAGGRLSPVMSAVPSPLQFRGSATLPPGDYTLRFAAADGERVGTVEHAVRARLSPAGGVQLSELLLGGPVEGREPLQPSVGHSVNFGLLHGYMEAVGPDAGRLRVRYEVASSETGEALLSADVEPVRAGVRAIFAHVMPVRQLPDGEYVLRATVLDPSRQGERPVSTLTRTFEVAPPAVLMAPAEGGGGTLAVLPEVFLPVDDARLNRPFDRREPGRRDVLQAFRDRVGAGAVEAFDRGVAELSSGEYGRAETNFKSAIQIDADSTAAIAYLAATFAAAGDDQQAAGAWQTALIDGGDLPQIYLWLGDALLRLRDVVAARGVLEEAAAKWPADVRFAKPLALVYATSGLGREAVRLIERHLADRADDTDALAMAVEWMYHLHTAGATATNRTEDLARAREYAAAYGRAKGPQAALVKQWLGAIEAAAP